MAIILNFQSTFIAISSKIFKNNIFFSYCSLTFSFCRIITLSFNIFWKFQNFFRTISFFNHLIGIFFIFQTNFIFILFWKFSERFQNNVLFFICSEFFNYFRTISLFLFFLQLQNNFNLFVNCSEYFPYFRTKIWIFQINCVFFLLFI